MAKALTLMARACLYCQQDKVHKHVHLQPAEILVPHRHFAHIHVDLVEPLLPSRGHTYLFTIIDRTLRWPEAIPLSSIIAADCARALAILFKNSPQFFKISFTALHGLGHKIII
jgi:hypothetical protein